MITPGTIIVAIFLVSLKPGHGYLRNLFTLGLCYWARIISTKYTDWVRATKAKISKQEEALSVFSSNQSQWMCLVRGSWYFNPTAHVSRTQLAAQCYMRVFTTVIFLMMQPKAYRSPMNMLWCKIDDSTSAENKTRPRSHKVDTTTRWMSARRYITGINSRLFYSLYIMPANDERDDEVLWDVVMEQSVGTLNV
eukprot:gene31655-39103_t